MNRLIVCVVAAAVLSIGTPDLLPVDFHGHTVSALDSPQTIFVRIMPLGDSITFGTPDPSYGGYRHWLGTLLTNEGYYFQFVGSLQSGDDVISGPANEGHPGWTISEIKDGIDSKRWLETYQPDLILLHIGTNDLGLGDAAAAPGNLSALLDDILKRLPKTHVIVAQIIPSRGGADQVLQSYDNAIARIASSKGPLVSTVDMRDILSPADYIDNLHPAASGYDKMAQAWEGAIRRVLGGTALRPAT